ncbi:MAG: TonB-dependent receptor plug domain-containing protein, partial [Planctomycetota bacterium]
MGRRIAGTVFALILLAGVARAEEERAEQEEAVPRSALDEEIVVTVARFERDLRSTGASVSVVDATDLRDRQVTDVSEAISIVPGAFISRGGPPGSSSSLFLRGAASNQVLVLLDGIPLNDPTLGGQFNFYDLGSDNLEAIEVLRGSASTLHGSEAIGGVVHLRTLRGDGEPGMRFGVEAGSYHHLRAIVSGQGRVEDVDFSASLSRTGVENDLENNRFDSLTASGRFGWRIAPGFEAFFSGRWVDSTAEDPWAFPFGEQIEEDANITRDRRTAAAAVGVRHDLTEELRWSLTGTWTDIRSDLEDLGDNPGDPVELVSSSDARVGTVQLLGEWRRTGIASETDLAVMAGVDYRDERSKNRSESAFGATPPIDETVRNTAVF